MMMMKGLSSFCCGEYTLADFFQERERADKKDHIRADGCGSDAFLGTMMMVLIVLLLILKVVMCDLKREVYV
jgi:hypothetical protein